MPIIINRAPPARQHVPDSPIIIGLVGTSIQASGENAPTYGAFFDVSSISEAEARFGTGKTAGREGSIVEAIRLIESQRLPTVKAAAVDVSAGLDNAGVRTAINNAVDAIPTECTFMSAPGLATNFNGSGHPLTTVCTTVAHLQARAAQADAIAFTDYAYDSLADAIAYLGVAGNVGNRVLPVGPRLYGTDASVAHPASGYTIGAILKWADERGAEQNWSGVPVSGVTRQEVEMLRTPGDANSAVPRIRAAGGSVVAWSGSDWRMYGGRLGGASATVIERFASVRRVEDIMLRRIYAAYEPFEEDNLTADTIPAAVAAGGRILRRARAEGLIAGFTIAPDDDYNTPANLAQANVGIGVHIDVYTPIGNIRITLGYGAFVPAIGGADAAA